MYFEELRRYIFYRGGDAALADDVVQQTFLRVWEKQPVILPGKEKAFLYKIASDEFIDQTRKKKRSGDFTKELELMTDGLTPEEELAYTELALKYKQALANMKAHHRAVFMMNRKEGLTYSEIAMRLNLSVKAIEKRMKSALEQLKRELNQR